MRLHYLVIELALATHKVAGVKKDIKQAGAQLLYLAPYSVGFNPIENMWSKVKQKLRASLPEPFVSSFQPPKPLSRQISPADRIGFLRPCPMRYIISCNCFKIRGWETTARVRAPPPVWGCMNVT